MTQDFFEALYPGGIPEGHQMVTFRDVYFGVCLQPDVLQEDSRGDADTATFVPGCWVDIDIQGEGHKKAGLAESDEQVLGFLARLELEPSAIVTTGGGFHVYWIFHEPFEIETQEDREQIASIVWGWEKHVQAEAKKAGFLLDSVADLARVLRIPGLVNEKYGVEVTAEVGDARHNPADFEPFAVFKEEPRWVESVQVSSIPELNPRQLNALLEVDDRVQELWYKGEHPAYASRSEQDLALASRALHMGWTYEAAAALVVAYRQKHGDSREVQKVTKIWKGGRYAGRQGYLCLTLEKALSTMKPAEVEQIGKVEDHPESKGNVNRTTFEALTGLSVDVVKLYDNPDNYKASTNEVVLKGGETLRFTSLSVLSAREWEAICYHKGISFKKPSTQKRKDQEKSDWKTATDALRHLYVEMEADEGIDQKSDHYMLVQYSICAELWRMVKTAKESYHERLAPFPHDGRVWFRIEKIRTGAGLRAAEVKAILKGYMGATDAVAKTLVAGISRSFYGIEVEKVREIADAQVIEVLDRALGMEVVKDE